MRTWPEPTQAALDAVYEAGGYHASRSESDLAAWDARAEQIVQALPANVGSVLDFGAGEGHLVAALRRRGLTADGVDASDASRRAALAAFGITLQAELPPPGAAAVDAVTLLHSLEHVPDPVSTMAAIRSLLRGRGAVFIEVPHAGSVDMLMAAQRRDILDLPVHLHHFTPSTLSRLLPRAGFTPTEVRLFNATAVEGLLGRRAAPLSPPVTATHGNGGSPEPGSPDERADGASSRVMAVQRRLLPGPKFQVIAQPR